MLRTHLPPDVLYWIFCYIQDDHPTLRSASIVCRSWVRPSQRFLLRKARLTKDADVHALCAAVRESASAWGFVSSISVHGGAFSTGWDDFFKLIQATQGMSSLVAVRFEDLEGTDSPPPEISSMTVGASTVRDVTIANVTFNDYQSAFVALQSFPAVRNLTLNACIIASSSGTSTSTLDSLLPVHPLALDKLSFQQCKSEQLAPLLNKLFAEGSPKALHAQAMEQSEFELLYALCTSIGESVHNLYFSFDMSTDNEDILDNRSLDFPRVRVFHLEFLPSTEPLPLKGSDIAEVLLDLYSDIDMPFLEFVAIDMRALGAALLDDLDEEEEQVWENIYTAMQKLDKPVRTGVLFGEEHAERIVVQQLGRRFGTPAIDGLMHVHVGSYVCHACHDQGNLTSG